MTPSQFLCNSDELSNNQSKGIELGDLQLFIVRKHQQLFAYRNQCPHLGIKLEWMPDSFLDVDNELIQCSTHGALFTIEAGDCVSGPCNGQKLEPLSVSEIDGKIFLNTATLS